MKIEFSSTSQCTSHAAIFCCLFSKRMTRMHFKKHLGELVLFDDTELQGHCGMRDKLSDLHRYLGGMKEGAERQFNALTAFQMLFFCVSVPLH